MDKSLNPYSPGAGTEPAALVGRNEIIESAVVQVKRLQNGRSARGMVLTGLRGVGKTVLLARLEAEFESLGAITIWLEAPEKDSFTEVLVPRLRETLLGLEKSEVVKDYAHRAMTALAGFVKGLKVSYSGVDISLEYPVEKGLADSGVFTHDLREMFINVGRAAQVAGRSVIVLIDEMQYADRELLAALIEVVHKCTQMKLPVLVFGAGLPQITAIAGEVKSYTERMFIYTEVGRLDKDYAADVLKLPAADENVIFNEDAASIGVTYTDGYPYFLQEFGYQAWNIADGPDITADDAQKAVELTTEVLDSSFFQSRLDRLTPLEVSYLRAMSELGTPCKSSDVADFLSRANQSLGPCRASLVEKGVIWSPKYSYLDFSVPRFSDFLRRRFNDSGFDL